MAVVVLVVLNGRQPAGSPPHGHSHSENGLPVVLSRPRSRTLTVLLGSIGVVGQMAIASFRGLSGKLATSPNRVL